MKNKDKIIIANTCNICFSSIANYSRHLFSCDIMLKSFFETKLLAKYKCYYLLKSINGNKIIEFPQHDVSFDLDVLASSDWSIACVTEQFLRTPPVESEKDIKIAVVTATFNVYKQVQPLGNKRFYDTLSASVL